MKSLTLEGTERKELGGKYAAKIRRVGLIPCVIYGGSETVHFYAPYNSFHKIVYNPEFFTIVITVNGKEYNTILKEIQFHPTTDRISHIDFLELSADKKVTAEIPLKLRGLAVGVKDGGVLDQKIRRLKVRALPKDLMEHIEINIENLQLGKSIRIADIKLENIDILHPSYMPVAATYIPRVVEETPVAAAVPAEGEAAAPAEGESAAGEGEKKAEGKAEAKAEKPEGKEKK